MNLKDFLAELPDHLVTARSSNNQKMTHHTSLNHDVTLSYVLTFPHALPEASIQEIYMAVWVPGQKSHWLRYNCCDPYEDANIGLKALLSQLESDTDRDLEEKARLAKGLETLAEVYVCIKKDLE